MLKIKQHSQNLAPYLFQNDVGLYFEFCWKREGAAEVNFWCFNKLNDRDSQWKRSEIFAADQVKSYDFEN